MRTLPLSLYDDQGSRWLSWAHFYCLARLPTPTIATGLGKGIKKMEHISEIQVASSEERGHLTLIWSSQTFDMEMDEGDAMKLLMLVRQQYAILTLGWPSHLTVTVKPADRMLPVPEINVGPDGGFMGRLGGALNLFHAEPHTEFLEYLAQCFTTGDHTINLNLVTGLTLAEFMGIIRSMHCDTWFTRLTCSNTPVPADRAVAALAAMLATNRSLATLETPNLGAPREKHLERIFKKDRKLKRRSSTKTADRHSHFNKQKTMLVRPDRAVAALAAMLATNRSLATLETPNLGAPRESLLGLLRTIETNGSMLNLSAFDFSGADLHERGAQALGLAIQALPQGIRVLKLTRANITPRGFASLFHTTNVPLDTNVPLGSIVFSLRHTETLRSLDLSENRLETMDALCMVEVLATTRHLRCVQLRAMKGTPEVLLGVVGSFSRNDGMRVVHIDISANEDIVSHFGTQLGPLESPSLHGFFCNDVVLTDRSFENLVAMLKDNRWLRFLSLARAWRGITSKQVRQLATWVQTCPTLRRLNLAGGGKANKLGAHLIPLFDVLKTNTALRALDVSDQCMGDEGAIALAEMLRANRSLRELCLDGNGFTFAGLKALHDAIATNATLVELPVPTQDIQAAFHAAREQNKVQAQLQDLIAAIQTKLQAQLQDLIAAILTKLQANRALLPPGDDDYDGGFAWYLSPLMGLRGTAAAVDMDVQAGQGGADEDEEEVGAGRFSTLYVPNFRRSLQQAEAVAELPPNEVPSSPSLNPSRHPTIHHSPLTFLLSPEASASPAPPGGSATFRRRRLPPPPGASSTLSAAALAALYPFPIAVEAASAAQTRERRGTS
ncbi:putative leucine-rich repeat-containing protein 16 [Paratrimastix pyriformis]|uniref:Leucine-rich repeat-containing protein 16 n=1 Tax=Paratrimastix pyriformis TaxID=342808 RepID=A0ABQ8UJY2_9EUKA|nr:putative leucine-rich repeat-containing protein 16 [Paratrimastix pyriformis]